MNILEENQMLSSPHHEKIIEELKEKIKQLEQDLLKLKDTTQSQLIQASKMSAIGQLAAGVAHEINNPLTTAYGFAELLIQEIQNPSHRKDLGKIIKSLERCEDITAKLLSFARFPQEVKKLEPTDVNKTLRLTLSLVASRLAFNKIKIVTALNNDLPKVDAIPSELQQVYMNLILNAQGAMPKGGKLIIKSSRIEIEQNEYVEIKIGDTGVGIPRENLERIFEPFFTTKEPGEGTGLGLSVSYGIIKNCFGSIEVTSELGEGTTFIIRLPALAGKENLGESSDGEW